MPSFYPKASDYKTVYLSEMLSEESISFFCLKGRVLSDLCWWGAARHPEACCASLRGFCAGFALRKRRSLPIRASSFGAPPLTTAVINSFYEQYYYNGDVMKKLLCILLCTVMILCFCACSKSTFMDISAFTDYYNRAAKEKAVELSDYLYRDGAYSLVLSEDSEHVLLTLETDSQGIIEEIRLTVAKVDGDGKEKQINEKGRALFSGTLLRVMQAFTFYGEAECEGIIKEMTLDRLTSFNSTGELTLTRDEWHFVYFSTQISSTFMIYNIHLQPVSKTLKPESKPAFGNTAYTRAEKSKPAE